MFKSVYVYKYSMIFLLMGSLTNFAMCLNCLYLGSSVYVEWEIVSLNTWSIFMTLILDWMSHLFMSAVMLISSMVLFYSGSYMSQDSSQDRFMFLVLFFVLSMIFLIISPNLVSILLGWDGLGLVSYCLVIYYQNEKSNNAGMLTALSNRVGDVAILLSIFLMFEVGSWSYIFYLDMMKSMEMVVLQSLVVLAAMTKSAQIPFSSWLPAAMAAPTPVSALVHSSTLVTAGVYLLIRFSPLLESSTAFKVLFLISSTTMFMSGLGANFEYDLKKIIALSTLSQLGVMMSILSMGLKDLAFFHLITHALFKALLFMCAGALIHVVKEYQDIRLMGNLVYFMPLTGSYMSVANLALCGTPFLAGFYSKDMILEMMFMSDLNKIIFLLFFLGTGLTVCYSFRLVYYVFTGQMNLSAFHNIEDSDLMITNPMTPLFTGAVFSGAFISWLIFPYPYMICMSFYFKTLALWVSVAGGLLGYYLNMVSMNYPLKSLDNYSLVVFMGSMWFMPYLSTKGLSSGVLSYSQKMKILLDKGWSEFYGGQGIYHFVFTQSNFLEMLQSNVIKVFMMLFMIFLLMSLTMLL
uniref:NADH-ubiquinone oxidoreductase chain 5 n=1 Tax=Belzebub intermedius TaxID=2306298 RepID=A0A346RNH9_9EUCA|nr:NADH dehydrogenase subunit 5 [Belzebub intermedius]AXS67626.1 NADH dehydrogenase subunit 5 [Belzebub intermedius]